MRFNPDAHHRKTIRLPQYDYSQPGYYFITLCTRQRLPLFGQITLGRMILNGAGKMLQRLYNDLPNKFSTVVLDEFVIMPNHMHMIIQIVDRATTRVAPTGALRMSSHIGDIVGAFKSLSTNEYIRGINYQGWPAFNGKLWQRNYWEHIIRSETDINMIREYIRNNPMQWELDELHTL
jgi:putative transposase